MSSPDVYNQSKYPLYVYNRHYWEILGYCDLSSAHTRTQPQSPMSYTQYAFSLNIYTRRVHSISYNSRQRPHPTKIPYWGYKQPAYNTHYDNTSQDVKGNPLLLGKLLTHVYIYICLYIYVYMHI